MEKIEGWDPHPTRKNIYISQKDGLLYKRLEGGWFDMIPQKVTLRLIRLLEYPIHKHRSCYSGEYRSPF